MILSLFTLKPNIIQEFKNKDKLMADFFLKNDTQSAIEAQYEAQKIAFAPVVFQVARAMRDFGILKLLQKNSKNGLLFKEIVNAVDLDEYGVKILLETSLSANIVKKTSDKYYITKTGYFLQNDELVNINMDFNHYVNYKGLYHLDESLKSSTPVGLHNSFGNDCDTIYPKLSTLPQKAKESWFNFDHFYSDNALDKAVNILLNMSPSKILDIGGNTGKFSVKISKKNENIKTTIADLPQQITLAKTNIKALNLENQIDFFTTDILDHTISLPSGFDIVWLSQFLDCFKEEDIVNILKRCKKALGENGKICIMEPIWDKQEFETSAFCIINTSPYFTAMANGYSKMMNSDDIKLYINKAGLKIVNEIDNVGICQSIIICN